MQCSSDDSQKYQHAASSLLSGVGYLQEVAKKYLQRFGSTGATQKHGSVGQATDDMDNGKVLTWVIGFGTGAIPRLLI